MYLRVQSCLSLLQRGGPIGLPLRASNEGSPRPRVARAQETKGLPLPPDAPLKRGMYWRGQANARHMGGILMCRNVGGGLVLQ